MPRVPGQGSTPPSHSETQQQQQSQQHWQQYNLLNSSIVVHLYNKIHREGLQSIANVKVGHLNNTANLLFLGDRLV